VLRFRGGLNSFPSLKEEIEDKKRVVAEIGEK
jgi:hypothetical protein